MSRTPHSSSSQPATAGPAAYGSRSCCAPCARAARALPVPSRYSRRHHALCFATFLLRTRKLREGNTPSASARCDQNGTISRSITKYGWMYIIKETQNDKIYYCIRDNINISVT